tara:strand:+ start:4114 stop:4497 length:384 start_codon:yes stop_codon:yes gene_type:complete
MKHYKLVQLYNAPINTSYQVFDIIPTLRERKNSAPVLNGTLSALTIYGDTLSGANALTVRITEDSSGDMCIIGDTQVGMSLGVTTATKTSSVIKIEIDIADTWPSHVWIKTDAGTLNVRQIKITWRV